MKKLFALLLALILVLSLSPMAMASNLNPDTDPLWKDPNYTTGPDIKIEGTVTTMCPDCRRMMPDCICGQDDDDETDLADIDYSWYLPVYLQRSRDIFGLRENTVRVELRPELDENGTLIYCMTDNLKNQLANNLRHLWLEEDGAFLNARTIVQYDLSYALDRHKLASPGESSGQPDKLKFENVPGLGDDGEQIRTKINVQELVVFESANVGVFSAGFSMEFQVTENGYEAEFASDKAENWDDMLIQNKGTMGDGGWKLSNGKWEYRFGGENEENTPDEQKAIYNEFSRLLIDAVSLDPKAENINEEDPAFQQELESRMREEHAIEKLKLTDDNMSAERFYVQQDKLCWQVDESTNAELSGLLSLEYHF